MPYQATDPSLHTTTFGYLAQYLGAYRTSTATPDTSSPNLAHHAVSGTYDLYIGQLIGYTDENNNTTTSTLDVLGCVSSIVYPQGGGSTQITFDDDYLTTHQRRQMNASIWSQTDTLYDGLGRLSRTATLNGGSGDAYNQADVCYDGAGRRVFQSYTYQGAGLASTKVCSGKGDTFTYDALNRPLTVTHADGTKASTSYSGGAVDAIDEGSNGSTQTERVLQSDALQRLISVCEVTGQSQANIAPTACGQDIQKTGFLTTYDYDVSDNLKHVNQGGLAQRLFQYDPASRLTSSFNPESGLTAYSYNPDGTLKIRTRPAPNQQNPATLLDTNYSYDEGQRLRTISYTLEGLNAADPYTPNVTMQYDEGSVLGTIVSNASGKLTSEFVKLPGQSAVNAGRYLTGYDAMGRLTGELQCPPRLCSPANGFDLQYGYDYAGNLISVQNSQFGTQGNTYNAAGQLTSVTHTMNGNTPVASNLTYGPFGLVTATLGNGLKEANIYDDRGRVTSRELGQGQFAPSLPEAAAIGEVLVSGSDQTQESQQYPSGSIVISGHEQRVHPSGCPGNNPNCYEYDSGSVSATINGIVETYSYGQGDTATTIASGLSSMFNTNYTYIYTGTMITSSGGILSIVGSLGGPQTPISAQVTFDTGDFNNASFTATPSGATLSGGGTIIYSDYGTAYISVNGHQDSIQFAGCDTAATVTYALINAINADANSSVTATAYNSAILLTDKQTGTAGNGYTITAGASSRANFPGNSFVLNTSGPLLEGGVDPSPTTQLNGPLYTFNLAYLPNGNVQSAKDSVNGNWAYTYDDMNRLSTAVGPASYQYIYDRFGNRLQQQLTAGSGLSSQLYLNSGHTNHLDGQCYDAAGNLLGQANCSTYVYDAENRVVSTSGGSVYVYDAESRRIAKQSGVPGSSGNIDTAEYVLSPSGSQIAESDGSGALLHTNVYAGGRLWATYAGSAMHYHTEDWLGTRRVQTEADGSVSLSCTNLAFGDGQNCAGADTTEQHYTGKERDTESGNDYFGARYFGSNMGRFMSPDPSGLVFADPTNPQSFNLYSYVLNNPLVNVDPNGLDCVHINNDTGAFISANRGDCDNSTEESANTGHYYDGHLDTLYTSDGTKSGTVTGFGGTDENGGYLFSGVPGAGASQGAGSPIAAVDAPSDQLSPYAQAVFQQTGKQLDWVPTACNFTYSASLSAGGVSVSVNDTEKGDSVSVTGSAALSNAIRMNVGINVVNQSPTASIRIGTPFVGAAVNPTSGQVGGYVGAEFGKGKATVGARLTTTVGRFSSYSGCQVHK